MGTSTGGATSAPSANDICATSAPSTDNIHLSISFCLRRLISGITSHVTWSKWLLFTLYGKCDNNRESRGLVTMKWCFSSLKMLSCSRKLRYQWRNSMKFTSYIQMIQGTAISSSCDSKKSYLKNFILPVKQPVSRRCDCQWFHWITGTPSARHTQETHPVRTGIDQRCKQTKNEDTKPGGV